MKGLGDGEAESASDWVTKLRKIQEEKKLAEKRVRNNIHRSMIPLAVRHEIESGTLAI